MRTQHMHLYQAYRECIIKLSIGLGLALTALALVFSQLLTLSEIGHTYAQTITDELRLDIDARRTTNQTMLIAPFKTMEVFLSEEKTSEELFTSVGGYWEEHSPEGTRVEVEMRFKINGTWTEWAELEEEEDMHDPGTGSFRKKYAMASGNPATAMQYKFLLYGDGVSSPVLQNPEWTFIRAGRPSAALTAEYAAFSATNSALAATTQGFKVLSRTEWGANESFRYLQPGQEAELVDIDPEWYEKFKDELQYSKVITEDAKGKYKWPLQYPMKVKKIIIHHTATTSNLSNPKQAIRDIYQYHALTRGWGDIGYNYIIDTEGTLYEGRFGGEGVIGAHSGPGNNGSIGIAVLGNYETTDVPEKVLSAITNLSFNKSKLHNIEPEGHSSFRGKLMPNIFGHKDIMATSCPGLYLYDKLALIRTLTAAAVEEKPKFVKDYDYQDRSAMYFLQLNPTEVIQAQLTLENIGKVEWNKDTFIVVNQNPEFEGVVSFPTKQGYVLASMNENLVKPGEKATFTFQVQGGKKSAIVTMSIAPVINGKQKLTEYIKLPVSVLQTNYKYEFLDAKYPKPGLDKGEKVSGWVRLRNSGNITWSREGEHQVVLRADHPQGRKSVFVQPTSETIGMLQETTVKPGEDGTFLLDLTAPDKAGAYTEYLTPYIVQDGIWMADSGMHFETLVYAEEYAAQFISKSAVEPWRRGKSYVVSLKLRNLGKATWSAENMTAAFMRENDLGIKSVKLTPKEVHAGEFATLEFITTVAPNETLGYKSLKVTPRVNGTKLFNKPITVVYTIAGTTTTVTPLPTPGTGESEPDIRIKISFSGEPILTADTNYNLYSGTKLLASLKSGNKVTVQKATAGYLITTPETTYTVNNPVRLVPEEGGIGEIVNFSHAPAWNPSLNDNQYRGTLEVHSVDGVLTVINELPLEEYLSGLGEVSNSEHPEKIKAIMTAARTYAKYYLTHDKFVNKPYHLDDDPNVSQKYLGYGLEKRSPNVAAGVQATRGEVVTYKGTLVKTPYFNQSDGTVTKSAQEVWGWTDTPYLVSVSDSYCKATLFLGHGVGLSGCGAKGMAEAGKTYKEILTHYYTGVQITDQY